MKEIEITDKRTIEEAIDEGLNILGVSKSNVDVEVLSAGGLFSKPKVKLTVKESIGTKAECFVKGLLKVMEIEAETELTENLEDVKINLTGSDMGGVIGYRGEVLDAIQYLASTVANLESDKETHKRVHVNTENYRERRAETLEALADRMADKAVANARRVSLDPMNSYERRIIHLKLQDNPEVTAHSEGEEPNRRLVIVPKCEKPRNDRKGNNNRGGGNDRFNNRGNSGNRKPIFNSDRRKNYSEGEKKQGGFSEADFRAADYDAGFSDSTLAASGKNYTSSKKYNK